MRPHAGQTGQQVFVPRQLDLRLGIGRGRPAHENIENQARTVQYPPAELFLQVACLGRRELVVENHHVDLLLLHICHDLLQFARPHESPVVGHRQFLHETGLRLYIGRLGQKLQFVEVLRHLTLVLSVTGHGHQYGPFPLVFPVYRIFFQIAKI